MKSRRAWLASALSVVVFLMLVGSVAANTKATKEMLTHSTTTSSLYLGTITATAPSLFTLGITSRLERVFYFQGRGNHPRRFVGKSARRP